MASSLIGVSPNNEKNDIDREEGDNLDNSSGVGVGSSFPSFGGSSSSVGGSSSGGGGGSGLISHNPQGSSHSSSPTTASTQASTVQMDNNLNIMGSFDLTPFYVAGGIVLVAYSTIIVLKWLVYNKYFNPNRTTTIKRDDKK